MKGFLSWLESIGLKVAPTISVARSERWRRMDLVTNSTSSS